MSNARKILIIDDDDELRESLSEQLSLHEEFDTLLAATAWGLFNAGYIVYLSFAPRVLMDSSSVQLMEQWSMMQLSLDAIPMPSRVMPEILPGRTRR